MFVCLLFSLCGEKFCYSWTACPSTMAVFMCVLVYLLAGCGQLTGKLILGFLNCRSWQGRWLDFHGTLSQWETGAAGQTEAGRARGLVSASVTTPGGRVDASGQHSDARQCLCAAHRFCFAHLILLTWEKNQLLCSRDTLFTEPQILGINCTVLCAKLSVWHLQFVWQCHLKVLYVGIFATFKFWRITRPCDICKTEYNRLQYL